MRELASVFRVAELELSGFDSKLVSQLPLIEHIRARVAFDYLFTLDGDISLGRADLGSLFHTLGRHLGHGLGDRVHRLHVHAERLIAHQHLAGHLEQDALVAEVRRGVGHAVWSVVCGAVESGDFL